MSEHVEALERAIRAGDVKSGLQAASALMGEAEAEANLAAAATAIDSNLAKLDEIKGLHRALEEIDRLLDDVVIHDGRNALNVPQAQIVAQKALGKPVQPGAF